MAIQDFFHKFVIEQEPSNLLVGGSIPSWGTRTHERRSRILRERRSCLYR